MTASGLAFGILAAPPLTVLLVVLVNLLVWPRGTPRGRLPGRVSVLIPARNEQATIERCVRGALGSSPPVHEVVVYDDGSTDETPAILNRLAREDARVRVVQGKPLPNAWIGKPHACHHLAEAATGDTLVFVDADTTLFADGLARLGSVLHQYGAGIVTVGTRQETGSWGERLVIPLLHLSYLAWLPLPLVWRTRDPRMLVANGQVMMVRREAYRTAGGWAAARSEVVDDMAFCRAAKAAGVRVVFADGYHVAHSRMYRGMREVWEGFSKNLYEGLGGRPLTLAVVMVLHAWIFVLPYAALGVAPLVGGALLIPALAGVGANVLIRLALALRLRHPPEGVLLHPLAVLVLLGIALNSYRWAQRSQIRWRGRTYAARSARGAAESHPS